MYKKVFKKLVLTTTTTKKKLLVIVCGLFIELSFAYCTEF